MRSLLTCSAITALLLTTTFLSHAATCRITGTKNDWILEVDGKPFTIKGVGCAEISGRDDADYFRLAVDMGATAIRTWGSEQGTKEYLDKANEYGLKVDAGIWLPHCNWRQKKKVYSYIDDPEKLQALEDEVLAYVKSVKDHPALIMWNVGNETLLFTNEEHERLAFCRFLKQLIVKIKAIDPDHPVLYTAATANMFPYLKDHVGNLDIIGVNTYGGVDYIAEKMTALNWEIPFLVTELGPPLPLNLPKDEFNRTIDTADYEKSFSYQFLLGEVDRYRGPGLGAFAFYLGETTQESLTWWNLTFGPYLRESYHVIREHYTGEVMANKPPFCTGLEIDKNQVQPGEVITASIKARDRENDTLTYKVMVGTSFENILKLQVNNEVPVEVLETGPTSRFRAPEKPDIYKLHALVFDGHRNVGIRTIAFEVADKQE